MTEGASGQSATSPHLSALLFPDLPPAKSLKRTRETELTFDGLRRVVCRGIGGDEWTLYVSLCGHRLSMYMYGDFSAYQLFHVGQCITPITSCLQHFRVILGCVSSEKSFLCGRV